MRRRFLNNEGFSSFYNYEDYLTIESLEDDLRVSFTSDIEYGIDGNGWKVLTFGREVIVKAGQLISFKGTFVPNTEIGVGRDGIGTFTINKKCRLLGNAMSLLFGDESKGKTDLTKYSNAFYNLFYNCTSILEVSNSVLPATTLANSCYGYMFHGCTSLVNAPKLPATTLADYCYNYMFRGCTSLVNAPELPATTLANSCYDYMFNGCKNLNYIKAMFTTTPSTNYTLNWVLGVALSGTFVKNPAMNSFPTGYSGIPNGWTVVNDGEESWR